MKYSESFNWFEGLRFIISFWQIWPHFNTKFTTDKPMYQEIFSGIACHRYMHEHVPIKDLETVKNAGHWPTNFANDRRTFSSIGHKKIVNPYKLQSAWFYYYINILSTCLLIVYWKLFDRYTSKLISWCSVSWNWLVDCILN